MHDLRRSAGTYMSQYGVPKDVRERVLNHGGMRKGSIMESVYNRYEYDAEKRATLELWADALSGIVGRGPTKVRHARLAGRLIVRSCRRRHISPRKTAHRVRLRFC
jgi:hypothetical protein